MKEEPVLLKWMEPLNLADRAKARALLKRRDELKAEFIELTRGIRHKRDMVATELNKMRSLGYARIRVARLKREKQEKQCAG